MRTFFAVSALLLTVLTWGSFPSRIFAQTQEPSASPEQSESNPLVAPSTLNLTVSPVTLFLETKPGVSVTSSVRVRNNGTFPERLTVSLKKVVPSSSQEKPLLRDFEEHDEEASWLVPQISSIIVNPGEWSDVELVFSPPATASLGAYYAIVFAREDQVVSKSGEAALSGAPAIIALALIDSPNIARELQLKDFRVRHFFVEYLPATFDVTIENTGNVHVVPSGDIFIDGNGKKDVGIIHINAGRAAVLPGSSRTYTSSWDDGFAVWKTKDEDGRTIMNEQGAPLSSLRWDVTKADRFRIGKYTAHLLFVYDNGERDIPIESVVTFWVFPWKLILLLIAIPVSPALLVYLLMKRRMKKQSSST